MGRYHYVDLLRGLAALCVLMAHYRWFYVPGPGYAVSTSVRPLDAWLWPLYDYGRLAVQLFWMLSGFVFAAAYRPPVQAREFVVHRIARLYPLHFLTLVIVAVLQVISLRTTGGWQVYQNNDLPHFLSHLFLASNWLDGHEYSFNGPIWSVSIEVLVYVLFYFYVRFGGGPLTALVIAGAALVVEQRTNFLLAQCVAMFFGGVIVHALSPLAERWLGKAAAPAAIAGLALVAGAAWLANAVGLAAPTVLIYLGIPCILGLFAALDLTARPLSRSWHWIGAITYSVYLLHMPLLIALRLAWPGIALWLPNPLTLLGFVASVVLLALLSYHFFERPAQQSIRRAGRRRSPAAAVAAE